MSRKRYAKLSSDARFVSIVQKLKEIKGKYSIEELVVFIYDCFQEYMISEKEEEKLYRIADPNNEVECPADLWFTTDFAYNPLIEA